MTGAVAVPPEGTLLPETYKVPRGMTRAALLAQMQAAQQKTVTALWPQRQKGLPVKTPQEAVILASIVERETGVAGERPLVAAAFINRLNKKMRLQSDPTIIYGLVGGKASWAGRSGAARSAARPPTTPTASTACRRRRSPIRDARRWLPCSIRPSAKCCILWPTAPAAMFVETLAEHNRNVRRWRQIEKQLRR